jgi:hypothetical protein
MRRPFLYCLLLPIGLCSCIQDVPTPEPPDPLDPNIDPVTEGTWTRPQTDLSWHWQLTGTVDGNLNVDLMDLDLFETPDTLLAALHQRGVLCVAYFSAGTQEEWRPDIRDLDQWSIGNPLEDWAGERWLDIRHPDVWAVMQARIQLAAARGFDGVEFDNVDLHEQDSGFPLLDTDNLAWCRMLANEAHRQGLFAVLKNNPGQVPELVGYFDMALNEQCHQTGECTEYQPFVAAGKPVLNAEYAANESAALALGTQVCPESEALGLNTLILPLELDGSFRVACGPVFGGE